jgi:hypothetical protein
MEQPWNNHEYLTIHVSKFITLTYVLVFIISTLRSHLFLIANMPFTMFTIAELLILSIMDSSTLG